jgi:citrate synthase
MKNERASKTSGLEGVVVAETELSDVDGERGRLVIRGYQIEELAGRVSFEAACGLLWTGQLPPAQELAELERSLGIARARAFELLPRLGDALEMRDGMEALRASLAHLVSGGHSRAEQLEVLGATAVFAAAWARRHSQQPPIAPDPSQAHAADYLRMVRGKAPSLASVDAMNTYLVTVIDHGMNASTFAARVVASTGSDLVSAVVAAVGALKGPLHGGAPGPVLEMLRAVGAPEKARLWLTQELAAGRRIMGMGHRIYRVRDPRAAVLEQALVRLERAGVSGERLELARSVEKEAERVLKERHPERALPANVEFYTAVLLDAIGLPRDAFSPTFAVSRVAGWCAHFTEQRADGRLIRPASRYVGPAPSSKAPEPPERNKANALV